MKKHNAILLFFVGSCLFAACQQKDNIKLLNPVDFEAIIDGRTVNLYKLTNDKGLTMEVTNYGARVVSLWTLDKNGNYGDIVLGHPTLEEYVHNVGERFLGAAIGRYGNRIAKGHFNLDSVSYQLSTYNNGQCLHGGDKGFDRVVWTVDSVKNNAIYFSYLSKDMEEGFPGNLMVYMTYILTPENDFRIEYTATTDKTTPVNLTHHSFFNLKGEGHGSINEHVLCVNANNYTPVDSVLIPYGTIEPVKNTPFDFRTPTAIGERVNQHNQQLLNCKGYDHNFVLNRTTNNSLELAASVYEPESGRYMEVWTTEPGLQFYGGNFFDGKTLGKNGLPYDFRGSFALETQHFPDSPNQPTFPSTLLHLGEKYYHVCQYHFSTK